MAPPAGVGWMYVKTPKPLVIAGTEVIVSASAGSVPATGAISNLNTQPDGTGSALTAGGIVLLEQLDLATLKEIVKIVVPDTAAGADDDGSAVTDKDYYVVNSAYTTINIGDGGVTLQVGTKIPKGSALVLKHNQGSASPMMFTLKGKYGKAHVEKASPP